MSTTEAVSESAPPLVIEQKSRLAPYIGLSLKNGLLNIITLSLYRFWGKTEVRRRVWSQTFINGEPLEYTGRGMELFKGFLIAVFGLGLPFVLIVGLAQLMGPVMAALIIIPLYLGLFFLFGFGMFTAFRYLASRTQWRGIRFHLRGKPADYGLVYLAFTLLSGVTLGWFWPAAARQLSGRLWGGLTFGNLDFGFDLEAARKVKVYPAYALGWVVVILGYVFFILAIIGAGVGAGAFDPEDPTAAMAVMSGIWLGAIIFTLVVLVAFAPYQAAALRSVAAGVRIGEARFKLELSALAMAGFMLSTILLFLVSFGFLTPLLQARTIRFMLRRLKIEGGVDLNAVGQSADAGPKTAEGLADALGASMI